MQKVLGQDIKDLDERKQFLLDNADEVVEMDYSKAFDSDELAKKKTELAEKSIKINDLNEAIKDYKEMEEKKCYISLPITGRDIEKVKKDIERIKIQLIHNGYSPVSPFDREVDFNATHEQHMREDFKLLLDCDAIYMADEWTNSKGCKAEFDCALACGIKPIFSLYSILQW